MTPVERFIRVDRSRIVARQECPTSRYYGYDCNGTGITSIWPAEELEFGIAMHEALAHVLIRAKEGEGPNWKVIDGEILENYRLKLTQSLLARKLPDDHIGHVVSEQVWLLRMLVLGWTTQRLPAILDEYSVESVEQEFEVKIASDMRLMGRYDAVLKHRATGVPFILDYKSAKTVSTDWIVAHEHSAQTYLYVHALGLHLDCYVGGIMYEGLLKGINKEESNKFVPWSGLPVQHTPLCYVYTNESGDMQLEYTKAKGWRKTAAWQISTPEQHLKAMQIRSEGERLAAFITCPPVRPTTQAMETVVTQIVRAEREYSTLLVLVRAAIQRGEFERVRELENQLFEQHFWRCYKYGSGHGCQFTPICHGGVLPNDCTEFIPRVPHHSNEFENVE
jgi:hypothetical protein